MRSDIKLGIVIFGLFIFLAGFCIALSITWPWISIKLSDSTEFKYDCVVSAYRENLDWLHNSLPGKPNIIVYSKHEDSKLQWPDAISLPNVGRCDHTYLYHIIENYDNLAPVTLFVTGSANIIPMKKFALDYVIYPRLASQYKCLGLSNWTLPNLKVFTYDSQTSVNRHGHPGQKEPSTIYADIRPLGAWWDHNFPKMRFSMAYIQLGVFAASRNAIRSISISKWKMLLKQHEIGDNVEVGHYMERIWYNLLLNGYNRDDGIIGSILL